MGILTFSLNVTLDGCVDHQEGIADDETHAFFTRLMDESGAMLWGRVTYEMMEGYWPVVARGDAEVPPAIREWAVKLEAKPKHVVSLTRTHFPWTNSHHIAIRRLLLSWVILPSVISGLLKLLRTDIPVAIAQQGTVKTQTEKSDEFIQLHQPGNCFIIPNPWDRGSAKLLQHLGFKALASTGAGFAFSQGRSDLSINARDMLAQLTELVQSTDLPISADLQNGFGHTPEDAAHTIIEAANTGIVGGSLEDASGDATNPIYDVGLAVERIQSAAAAAKSLNFKFTLTARAENYLYGRADLKATIKRLQAYQEAGADVLYAPGIQSREDIKAIVQSIDRPLNVLMGLQGMQLTVAEVQALGVTRISLGGSLARAAYGALVRAAREVQALGTFSYVDEAISGKEINSIFSAQNL